MIKLVKVTDDNLWDLIKLKVKEDQEDYVASNTESFLDAYLALSNGFNAFPYGLENNGTLVGFIMFGYGPTEEDEELELVHGNCFIWRIMIDRRYQGQGLGHQAMNSAMDFLKSFPYGPANLCWVSYDPNNLVARHLYQRHGFIENGMMADDEVIAIYEFK